MELNCSSSDLEYKPGVDGDIAENTTSDSSSQVSSRKRSANKKMDINGEDNVIRSNPKRVWSCDDESNLLSAMINFYNHNPKARGEKKISDELYKSIRNSVQSSVSTTQIRKKVAAVRRKYENHVSESNFKSEHDRKIYEMSKQVWGPVDEDDEEQSCLCSECGLEMIDLDKIYGLEGSSYGEEARKMTNEMLIIEYETVLKRALYTRKLTELKLKALANA